MVRNKGAQILRVNTILFHNNLISSHNSVIKQSTYNIVINKSSLIYTTPGEKFNTILSLFPGMFLNLDWPGSDGLGDLILQLLFAKFVTSFCFAGEARL